LILCYAISFHFDWPELSFKALSLRYSIEFEIKTDMSTPRSDRELKGASIFGAWASNSVANVIWSGSL
jgi:hypothetical protein